MVLFMFVINAFIALLLFTLPSNLSTKTKLKISSVVILVSSIIVALVYYPDFRAFMRYVFSFVYYSMASNLSEIILGALGCALITISLVVFNKKYSSWRSGKLKEVDDVMKRFAYEPAINVFHRLQRFRARQHRGRIKHYLFNGSATNTQRFYSALYFASSGACTVNKALAKGKISSKEHRRIQQAGKENPMRSVPKEYR